METPAIAPAGPLKPEQSKVRRLLRRPLVVGGVGLALLVGGTVGTRAILHARAVESTDDAFLEGRIVSISPRVAGHVLKVYVDDNQPVKAGQLLAEIDPADFQAKLAQTRAALAAAKGHAAEAEANLQTAEVTSQAALDQAKAGVSQAESGVRTAQAEEAAARSAVSEAGAKRNAAKAAVGQAQAEVTAAKAEEVRAASELSRTRQLRETNVVGAQELVNTESAWRAASARLDAANKKVTAAEASVAEAEAFEQSSRSRLTQASAAIEQAQAAVAQAKAKQAEADVAPQRIAAAHADADAAAAEVDRLAALAHQAELDLSYTRVVAPEAGRVTSKSVENGVYVQPGQAMLAVVPDDLWVIANFKESQLAQIRPGQPVTVDVDAYPGLTVTGHVDSIQRGSGSRFSLLPPENATGNYVKVVQRVPVKIAIDSLSDANAALGPGMSVVPEVHVKG